MTIVPKELLKIGDFARLAKINIRTLRYHEELGLLQPALRSDGGCRYYRPADVNRVRMIHNLQELGLALENIRDLLDTRPDETVLASPSGGAAWLERIRNALGKQQVLIENRIESLERQKALIHEAREKIDLCRPCEHTPESKNNFCEPCQLTSQPLPEFLSALF